MGIDLLLSLRCDIGGGSHVNEDLILVSGEKFRDSTDEFPAAVQHNGRFVAAIADGMGGHHSGESTSEMALDLFDDYIVNLPEGLSDKDFRSQLDHGINKIHQALSKSHTNPECCGMGTALVSWLTYNNRIYLVNAGDNRAYRLRNGILCQLTTDHTLQNKDHDHALPPNIIHHCPGGGGEYAFADIMELTEKVFEEDVFLLCSDGLYDAMSEEEIESLLCGPCHASTLIDAAKAKGSQDDISAIVITIKKME